MRNGRGNLPCFALRAAFLLFRDQKCNATAQSEQFPQRIGMGHENAITDKEPSPVSRADKRIESGWLARMSARRGIAVSKAIDRARKARERYVAAAPDRYEYNRQHMKGGCI